VILPVVVLKSILHFKENLGPSAPLKSSSAQKDRKSSRTSNP